MTDDLHVGLIVADRLANHIDPAMHGEDREAVVNRHETIHRETGGDGGQTLFGDTQIPTATGMSGVEGLGAA